VINGVNHVAINSADIDRLADFYGRMLGFGEATEEFSWRDVPELDALLGLRDTVARQRMLRAGNCYLELFEFEAPDAADSGPLRACDRGFTHVAFDVADIDAEMARLKALGMEFLVERPILLGPLRAIYGRDPDGNLVELIEAPSDHPYSLSQVGSRETRKLV
jgi:catechol 2,3-dioxygenase-like lactoylglutathione lyase family enzyme